MSIGSLKSDPTLEEREDAGVIEIRKYSNRRLYDTSASRYVTLSDVAEMIRAGRELRVVDAKTGEDLTRAVMLQIICESKSEQEALPIGFLRQVIQASSKTVRASIQEFLTLGLTAQKEVHHQISHWVRLGMMTNPLMAPFMTAWESLGKGARDGGSSDGGGGRNQGETPAGQGSAGEDRSRSTSPSDARSASEGETARMMEGTAQAAAETSSRDEEIQRLQAQLAALQQQIEALQQNKNKDKDPS